jgi:hypothetical protein
MVVHGDVNTPPRRHRFDFNEILTEHLEAKASSPPQTAAQHTLVHLMRTRVRDRLEITF